MSLEIVGYAPVSRLDRRGHIPGTLNHGGIRFYHKIVGGMDVTHLSHSLAERSWYYVRASLGPVLLGVCYRLPDDQISNWQSFRHELAEHTAGVISTIIVGDMNIHHKSWLSPSASDTPAGREL